MLGGDLLDESQATEELLLGCDLALRRLRVLGASHGGLLDHLLGGGQGLHVLEDLGEGLENLLLGAGEVELLLDRSEGDGTQVLDTLTSEEEAGDVHSPNLLGLGDVDLATLGRGNLDEAGLVVGLKASLGDDIEELRRRDVGDVLTHVCDAFRDYGLLRARDFKIEIFLNLNY